MNSIQIHTYIERLSNLLRNETRSVGAEFGLLPVQIEALHYLSICNRYSDTPMGVTDYLGQTKGSVSQSLIVLEKKGFLSKKMDSKDKRIIHMQVTKSGRQLLNKMIPAPIYVNAFNNLTKNSQTDIVKNLQALLKAIQTTNNLKSFGVCNSCRHNKVVDNVNGHLCNLTQEPLSSNDIQLICREHDEKSR